MEKVNFRQRNNKKDNIGQNAQNTTKNGPNSQRSNGQAATSSTQNADNITSSQDGHADVIELDVENDFDSSLVILDDILTNLDHGLTEEISMRSMISIVVNVLNVCPALFTAYVHAITQPMGYNGSNVSNNGGLPNSISNLSSPKLTHNTSIQSNYSNLPHFDLIQVTNSKTGPSPKLLEATLQRTVDDLFNSSISTPPTMQIAQLLTTIWNVLNTTEGTNNQEQSYLYQNPAQIVQNRAKFTSPTSPTSSKSQSTTKLWCINSHAHCCDQQYGQKSRSVGKSTHIHVKCLCDAELHGLTRDQAVYITQCVIVNRLALSLFTYNTNMSSSMGSIGPNVLQSTSSLSTMGPNSSNLGHSTSNFGPLAGGSHSTSNLGQNGGFSSAHFPNRRQNGSLMDRINDGDEGNDDDDEFVPMSVGIDTPEFGCGL
jgi:hypothetical protein